MAFAQANHERAYGVTNIQSHIPIILEVNDLNYDAWRELFLTHCQSFDVAGHLDGSLVPATENDETWKKRDGLVKLWLYGTLSKDLFRGAFKTGCTSREIWIRVENFFRDNKEARAIQLNHRLRTQEIGDLTIHAYCHELKSISDRLANVDAPVTECMLVTYMLNGLNAKFDNIINVIKHRQPFPTFDQARSMLILEEDRLNKGKQPHEEKSSSPNVLLVSAQTSQKRNAPPQPQQLFQSNRGRRGGNHRGRGRNFQPQYQQLNAPFWNPMWPNQPVNPWIQQQQQHQTSLLGPRPQIPSTSTQAYNAAFSYEPPTDYASAFNTFTPADPADNHWHMDSGATALPAHSADGGRDLPADPSDLRRYEAERWLRNTLGVVGGRDLPADPSDLRRYEAARWLRNTLGVVGGRDLPADPSEGDFRIALRSGILLCNALNRVKPGAIRKVVEAPTFENLRNFLVVVEEMGIPTFEVSDFEKGGESARIVECVLALKSYLEWKQSGGTGSWRYIVNSKPTTFGMAKQFRHKDSEANGTANSIGGIVRAAFSDKSQKEISAIMEDMMKSVMVEYERRLATQNEMSVGNKDKLDSGDLGRTISGNEERLSDASYGEEVTKIGNNKIEASHDDNVKESESKDYKFYEIPKEKTEKQQIKTDKQQPHTEQGGIYTCWEELKRDLKSMKVGLSLLQMKYQQEFTSLGEHLHGLAYEATGYQKVLEENRKLYNQVQELKGNIRVYCRVRPFLPGQTSILTPVDNIEESTISIATPLEYGKEGRKSFTFNKVFGPSASQESVFADTRPLIRSVLDGYNVCIFAYGQTGSGKTFTMMGPNELTEESLGVNYRALNDLFHLSNLRKETFSYNISVQMLEIYNEQVRDLLATNGQTSRLENRNSSQDGINVPDATSVPVSATLDILYLMSLGQKNRAFSATAMNDRSSRSHSCLTVHVQGRDLTSGASLRGSMHLVDLAGSERVDKSGVTGDRLQEAQHINKSLSALGDVIASIAQKSNHVSYHSSKLTQLLQDALGGQAKTLMFIHISPELEALEETLCTLKFAERVATVELGAVRVNDRDTSEVQELKEQIASLKLELARKGREEDQTLLPNPLPPDQLLRRKSLSVSSSFSKSTKPRKVQTKYKASEIDDDDLFESDSDSDYESSLDSLKSPSIDGKEEEMEFISGSEWIDIHEEEITWNSKPDNKTKKQPEKRLSSLRREPPRPCSKGFLDSVTKPKKDQPETSRDADCWNADDNRSSLIPMPSRRLLLGVTNSPGQTSSRHNTVVVKQRQNPKRPVFFNK